MNLSRRLIIIEHLAEAIFEKNEMIHYRVLPKIKKPMLLKKLKFTSPKCLKISPIYFAILCLFFSLYITPVFAEITGPHGDARIISPKGVCATCHIPHKAKGPKIWARTSTKPGLYDGIHQLCQTCHDGTMFFDGNPKGTDSVAGYIEGDYSPIKGYKGEFIVETRDDGEKDVYASTGTDDVLDELDNHLSSVGPYESHVMHGGADITPDEALIDFDSSIFPLDETDKDNFPEDPAKEKYRLGGSGFYCGTCHNPHKQPDSRFTGGFYLRSKDGDVGDPWNNREPFCSECHGDFHFSEIDSGTDCLTCHHPHLGKTLIKDDEYWGRKILRYPVVKNNFIAMPNVTEINDFEAKINDFEYNYYSSEYCYGCHNASKNNPWLEEVGVVPIYADGNNITNGSKEHHPMGTQASLDDDYKVSADENFIRAPGTPPEILFNGSLTCTSCHNRPHRSRIIGGDEGEDRKNNYLRWDFTSAEGDGGSEGSEDKTEFCVECHSDKITLSGKHLKTREEAILHDVKRDIGISNLKKGVVDKETVGCANCMFCHFIHDGKERQDTDDMSGVGIRPDVDSLMRISSLNLSWGERSDDSDLYDYEDMCYGCHGKESIAIGPNSGQDALLRPDSFFTHRFASQPDPNSPTISKIIPGGLSEGLFPLADGPDPATETFDDYGTQSGDIYCGTCHDVHAQYNSESPYLNSGESPYKVDGFCEACHDDQEENFVRRSHPIGKGPNNDPAQGMPTEGVFPDIFIKWEPSHPSSGQPGGVVTDDGEIICLTCHNTHAAVTSHEGKTIDSGNVHGKLLVMDNFPKNSTAGDDMCRACHSSDTFSEDNGVNGAHSDRNELERWDERGLCHNCHLPHKAKSEKKIWAITLKGEFDGVHDLCYSCHNPDDASTESGDDNVFSKGTYENHVMFGGAVLEAGNCPDAPSLFKYPEELTWPREFDKVTFPLDPNDRDNIPEKDDGSYCDRPTFSYREGGDGFYCGTCHNPHKDLSENSSGDGDYLRSKPDKLMTPMGEINEGTTGNRKPFCIQCHGLVHENITSDCILCHHPHKGTTPIEEDERMGRLIISAPSLFPKDFIALPNVPGITDDSENDKYTSRFCYQCHNEKAQEATGISAIFGDDAGDLKKEHHPMGTEARLSGNTFRRAKGPEATKHLNENEELTCTSCHDDFHGWGSFAGSGDNERIKANFFLRWVLNDGNERDKIDFCVACHDDKENLNGKHLIQADDPNSPNALRGGCMFCHFIHDGDERQDTDDIGINGMRIRPDVDSLMRFPILNLSWGDKTGDTYDYDYEDLCYGCHGKESIVGGSGANGALLEPNEHFTHPFSLPADPGLIGEGFTVSDGSDPNIPDDYGSQSGHIYCGTCHDVHNNQTSPYLGNHPTPYKYQKGGGFCEACHNKDGKFVSESHPVGVGPNSEPVYGAPTAPEFVDTYNGGSLLFSQGGSGRPGGITSPYNPNAGESTLGGTGQVICLTCHNVHAAVTSWEGKTKDDVTGENDHGFLLVKDNMKKREDLSPGSELCKACHPFGDSEYSFPEGAHGDGTLSGGEGICSACHTPHGSGDPKLWSIRCPSSNDPDRGCYETGPFTGFRQLCFSCHNVGYVLPGSKTVFKGLDLGDEIPPEGYYPEDHVMRYWADIDSNSVDNFDTSHFPLDSNDRDTIPTVMPDQKSKDGFYCGSCHNPHMQPVSGGYYLRSKGGKVGSYGRREDFCNQCHKDIHKDTSYENMECLTCHHPHNGSIIIDEDPDTGRLIYIAGYRPRTFRAKPNVDGFTGTDESSMCYGCHGPYPADPNRLNWSELGATFIYGDDVSLYEDANSNTQLRAKGQEWLPKEHHPMGKQARFGQSLRAPGADRSLFNKNGELTCTSCHSKNHKGERENNFLRWDFAGDNPHFCSRCHSNKQEVMLGPLGGGHHQTRETSPVKRKIHERIEENNKSINKEITVRSANCMFCHFIHDGDDQGDTLAPSLNTLMRVQPMNLRWADAWQDEDAQDYEDLCYGCHSQEKIVGGIGGTGSLFLPAQDLSTEQAADPILSRRFSHRFRSKPNPSSPTAIRLNSAAGPLTLSDGTGEEVPDDYGTEAGHMYCGTCHDVHTWAANPGTKYLKGLTSPYLPGGFCHECHSAETVPGVCTLGLNHRLAPAPGGVVSVPEWSSILYSNVEPGIARGKGAKGGFVAVPAGLTPNVGQMTCLTCHNIHAAETTYDGFTDKPRSDDTVVVDGRHGKLLIIDNGHGPAGSDLCISCHPEHSRIIGSFHDFSHAGLDGLGGGIAPKGVCSACHRPHLNLGERLWARPIIEEKAMFTAIPGFALGSTIFCYDCHSGIGCDADPLPDLFLPFPPQDVAFVDGPGGLIAGYFENLPAFVQDIPPHRIPAGMPTEIKTSGHYIRQPIATPGIAQNNKLPCNDCHNPHFGITIDGIANQAFIKPIIGGKPMGPYKASINMTHHKEIRSNLESRQVCVACHGLAARPNAPMIYPPATFTDVNPAYNSILLLGRPPSTVYDHFDVGLYACTDCHRHNRAMVLCIDCHGYPPIRVGNSWLGPGDPDQNYTGGAGAHYKHVIEHKFSCTMCHKGCLHDPGGATVVNPYFKRAKVSIDFDKSYTFPRIPRTSGGFQTRMGYYNQDGKPIIPPIYDPIKQTCYVGCHNPLVGDPDEIPNLDTPTPSWSLQASQAPTPPSFPGGLDVPSWITVRMPYSVPSSLPGTWQWLITWGP